MDTIDDVIQNVTLSLFSEQNRVVDSFFNAYQLHKNMNLAELKERVLIKRYPGKNEYLFDDDVIFEDRFSFDDPGGNVFEMIDNNSKKISYSYEHKSFIEKITFHDNEYYFHIGDVTYA